ncbi:MAG: hypothetical protein WAM91_11365 [Candidatus Acidiferrales bacterium]
MLAKIAMGFLVVTGMGTAYICQDGFVHVRVEESREGGKNVHLILPAELGPLAAHLVPLGHLRNAERDFRAALPALHITAAELAKLPDTLLVEVMDQKDHVRIAKVGDGLDIDSESPEEHVHVWVPLRAIYDTADALESRLGKN